MTCSLQTQWPTSIVSLLIGLNIFTPYFSNSPIASDKLKENKSENITYPRYSNKKINQVKNKSCYVLLCAPHLFFPSHSFSHPFFLPHPQQNINKTTALDHQASAGGWLCPIHPEPTCDFWKPRPHRQKRKANPLPCVTVGPSRPQG